MKSSLVSLPTEQFSLFSTCTVTSDLGLRSSPAVQVFDGNKSHYLFIFKDSNGNNKEHGFELARSVVIFCFGNNGSGKSSLKRRFLHCKGERFEYLWRHAWSNLKFKKAIPQSGRRMEKRAKESDVCKRRACNGVRIFRLCRRGHAKNRRLMPLLFNLAKTMEGVVGISHAPFIEQWFILSERLDCVQISTDPIKVELNLKQFPASCMLINWV